MDVLLDFFLCLLVVALFEHDTDLVWICASCSFDGQCISAICKATGLSSDDAEHLKEKFGENLLEALDLTPAAWHGYHALIWDATLYVV